MHLLCEQFQAFTYLQKTAVSVLPPRPRTEQIYCCGVLFSFFLYTPPEHRHAAPFPSHVSLPFSPQSNYLASEGGNLLSLVAAQVPIRGNTLHLSNELIALNELKTLLRREKKRGRRQVGMKGTQGTNSGMCENAAESGQEWHRVTLVLVFWCFLLDLLPTLLLFFFVKFKHAR